MAEKTIKPVKQKISGSKQNFWKVIIGIAVIIILISIIIVIVISIGSAGFSDKYKKVLSGYFQALTKNDTNAIAQLANPQFANDLSPTKFASGNYQLFSYHFENIENTNLPSDTNEIQPTAKILFSISTMDHKTKVSYLSEAYFVTSGGNIKISRIKKLYNGEDITK